jgi:symplekin
LPIQSAELLVALHGINTGNIKDVIQAINLCFGMPKVFTQDVLAVALQHLVEQTPLSKLFMRTVIQSLQACPKLKSFIMSLLMRLIAKKVWSDEQMWQGFIKCAQMTVPESLDVLLKLPVRELKDVITREPKLRQPLHDHLSRASIFKPSPEHYELFGLPPPSVKTGRRAAPPAAAAAPPAAAATAAPPPAASEEPVQVAQPDQ